MKLRVSLGDQDPKQGVWLPVQGAGLTTSVAAVLVTKICKSLMKSPYELAREASPMLIKDRHPGCPLGLASDHSIPQYLISISRNNWMLANN